MFPDPLKVADKLYLCVCVCGSGGVTELCKDPQASIKIKAELKNWVQREGGIHAEQEIDCSVADFLKPLGLQTMATRFEVWFGSFGCTQGSFGGV